MILRFAAALCPLSRREAGMPWFFPPYNEIRAADS
jgi:hypothetical protein